MVGAAMPFSFDKLLSHFRYTWALTSMVFGVTTMMGVFADMVGKHDPILGWMVLYPDGAVLLSCRL